MHMALLALWELELREPAPENANTLWEFSVAQQVKIQHCHCRGADRCCGMGSIPAWELPHVTERPPKNADTLATAIAVNTNVFCFSPRRLHLLQANLLAYK